MIIALNDTYSIKLFDKPVVASLNARDFTAQNEWAIEIDDGVRHATRYKYTTKYAKKKGLYFKCGNAKAAIQQAIIESKYFHNIKLSEMYFQLYNNGKLVQQITTSNQ